MSVGFFVAKMYYFLYNMLVGRMPISLFDWKIKCLIIKN